MRAPRTEIADWLEKLGMSEYAQRFAENRIDFSVLPDLTDQDLEKLGVLLGDRRKMLRAITDLEAIEKSAPIGAVADPAAAATATESVSQDTAERRQAHGDVLRPRRLDGALRAARPRGHARRHLRLSPLLRRDRAPLGGFVAKYMGDGVLVYFGYPQAHEHDAERAVRAGLALVEAVPKLKTAAGVPLQVRVGIATGLVVVGDLIGSGAAQEQAVVGETPNLAARLQALAEPGTVVISIEHAPADSAACSSTAISGQSRSRASPRPVPAWQALGASAAESRFEALRASTTPLVGRDEEIDLLLRRWEQAKGRRGPRRAALGRARHRQVADRRRPSLERLSGEPHTRLRYFCSPHHQDSALYPSITQLERAAGFRRDDTDEQRLAKLEAVLALATNDLGEAVPLLADLLSIPTGDRYPALDLTPQKRKEKTLRALVAQVEGLAARQPVLHGGRGRALGRSHLARAVGPDRRSGAAPAAPGDHHLPAGIHAALGRPSAGDACSVSIACRAGYAPR